MYTPSISNRAAAAVFLFTLLGLLLSFADASPIAIFARDAPNPTQGIYNVTPHGVVLGVLAIISGIYFCFFGYRFFKLTMFLTGFWFFANITYIGLVNSGASSQTLILVVSIIVGLLGGAILACCWHLGIYFLAALAGYALALWLLAWADGGLIQSNTGRVILIIVLIVLFIILAVVFELWVVIIATSIVGAYLIIFGIDIFAQTGFANSAAAFLSGQTGAYNDVNAKVYIMLAAFIILTLLGIWFQARFHRKNDFRAGATAPWGYGTRWGRNRNFPDAANTTKSSWWRFRSRT